MGRPTYEEPELYRLHAEVCKVLTDPKRLMILDALRAGDLSVGELADRLAIALPNASQHLAVLRGAGLVDGRRVGTTVVYRLAEPAIVDACDVIHAIVERRMAERGRPSWRSGVAASMDGPSVATAMPVPQGTQG
jgi:ArsR family transcriptional regulator